MEIVSVHRSFQQQWPADASEATIAAAKFAAASAAAGFFAGNALLLSEDIAGPFPGGVMQYSATFAGRPAA